MLTKDCFEIRILDHVLHADRDQIVGKIRKGAIVPGDQVKIDNETWIGIEYIPEFAAVFDAIERELHESQIEEFKDVYTNFQVKQATYALDGGAAGLVKCCAIHSGLPPMYICTVCESLFCETCPRIENDSKICLFCGGRCVLYLGQDWSHQPVNRPTKYNIETSFPPEVEVPIVQERLELRDFATALAYPFRFFGGLMTGCVLFATFVFGLIVTVFHGDWTLIVSAALLIGFIGLQFNVLTRTFDNFALGLTDRGFMPHVKGFRFGNDVVDPLRSGFTAYLEAFGPTLLLFLIALTIAWSGFEDDLSAVEEGVQKTESRFAQLIDRSHVKMDDRRRMVLERRMRQMESVFGSNHLVENKQFEKLVLSVTRMTIWYQLPISILFLIGTIFFPAICINTAGENRTLKERLMGGLIEMRTIGFDYVKLFTMFIFLVLASVAVVSLSGAFFAAMDLPIAGMLVSIVLSSFLAFYFWVSYSAILGITRTKREAA